MFFCSLCDLSFPSKICLTQHFKTKKHMNGNKENKYKCTCGKTFSYRQGLHGHRKKCIQTQTNINQPEQVIQVLQQELNKKDQELNKKDEELNKKDQEQKIMREEMDELRKKVEFLFEKTSGNTTNNNTNNINSQTNIENQYIVVNSFGNENIGHLTDQIICQLIKNAPFTCVPQLIEKIHFDPEHPENHNIKITNKKMNYAEIVKNNKWVTANKKKVIDDIIENSYNLLDEKYTENKESMSERRQDRFDNFQNKYETQDEILMKNIKNDVDLIVINGTNELHK